MIHFSFFRLAHTQTDTARRLHLELDSIRDERSLGEKADGLNISKRSPMCSFDFICDLLLKNHDFLPLATKTWFKILHGPGTLTASLPRSSFQELEEKYHARIEELKAALAAARETIEAQQNHMAELSLDGDEWVLITQENWCFSDWTLV